MLVSLNIIKNLYFFSQDHISMSNIILMTLDYVFSTDWCLWDMYELLWTERTITDEDPKPPAVPQWQNQSVLEELCPPEGGHGGPRFLHTNIHVTDPVRICLQFECPFRLIRRWVQSSRASSSMMGQCWRRSTVQKQCHWFPCQDC